MHGELTRTRISPTLSEVAVVLAQSSNGHSGRTDDADAVTADEPVSPAVPVPVAVVAAAPPPLLGIMDGPTRVWFILAVSCVCMLTCGTGYAVSAW